MINFAGADFLLKTLLRLMSHKQALSVWDEIQQLWIYMHAVHLAMQKA